jgi:hypothetical protein
MRRRWTSIGTGLLAACLLACSTPAVGAPCLPEQVPANGFDPRESYIESSSVQCESRVCVVYKLAGDPRESCNPAQNPNCADPAEVEESVYCTCRCDSFGQSDNDCDCPSGYRCTRLLTNGDLGVNGKYCIKSQTVGEDDG